MSDTSLGEFESAILLAVLDESRSPYSLEVRRAIEAVNGRAVSRGAFYTTMERLGRKGFVTWDAEVPSDARRALAQRRYRVTPEGMSALREKQTQLAVQWQRIAEAMGES